MSYSRKKFLVQYLNYDIFGPTLIYELRQFEKIFVVVREWEEEMVIFLSFCDRFLDNRHGNISGPSQFADELAFVRLVVVLAVETFNFLAVFVHSDPVVNFDSHPFCKNSAFCFRT